VCGASDGKRVYFSKRIGGKTRKKDIRLGCCRRKRQQAEYFYLHFVLPESAVCVIIWEEDRVIDKKVTNEIQETGELQNGN